MRDDADFYARVPVFQGFAGGDGASLAVVAGDEAAVRQALAARRLKQQRDAPGPTAAVDATGDRL